MHMKLLRQAIKALLTAGLPPERWLVRGPRGRLTNSPTISLTFDDGPHPDHTPRVLDELQRWGLTATFFVIGREAERFPQLVARMVAEGHELGNHTFTHTEPRETTAGQFHDEVRQSDQLISSWTAQPCRWMRPPKGELTRQKLQGLWRSGHTVVLWNVDPRDYRMTSLDEAVAWAEAYQPRHGDIVLLHDKLPYAAEMLSAWGRRGLFETWRSASVGAWLEPQCASLPIERPLIQSVLAR
jgi:peptidoglycan/xylan/chitin deacetylase (PgdA/CDA1 family)